MAEGESERNYCDWFGSDNTLMMGTGFISGNKENYGAHFYVEMWDDLNFGQNI